MQACKKIFCETFSVTSRRVQLLAEKIVYGKIDVSDCQGCLGLKRTVIGALKLLNT